MTEGSEGIEEMGAYTISQTALGTPASNSGGIGPVNSPQRRPAIGVAWRPCAPWCKALGYGP